MVKRLVAFLLGWFLTALMEYTMFDSTSGVKARVSWFRTNLLVSTLRELMTP